MRVDVRRRVVVIRRWSKPEVEIFVSEEGVGAQMDMDRFLEVVMEEVGSPMFIFSRVSMAEKVKLAAHRVLAEMKKQTARLA